MTEPDAVARQIRSPAWMQAQYLSMTKAFVIIAAAQDLR